MCQIKILINVEQNAYWLIITSVLRSECWVFTEPLEHSENTPMIAAQYVTYCSNMSDIAAICHISLQYVTYCVAICHIEVDRLHIVAICHIAEDILHSVAICHIAVNMLHSLTICHIAVDMLHIVAICHIAANM